jgi:glycosyltransferase involved in cell wall biosynthesis
MRILWLANSPLAPSGYGGQSALFGPRIRDLGHEVAFAANFYLHSMKYKDIPIFDATGDAGNGKISTWQRFFDADWVICLHDAWVMRPDAWDKDLKMAIWAPIDHHPIPPLVLNVLQAEKVRPIAMSRFGESWMQKFDLDPLYVPHGVDTEVFYPREVSKDDLVKTLTQGKVPEDSFLVGMVAANRGWSQHSARKSFPQALEAFARFSRRHLDAYLYLHTEMNPGPPGIDLGILCKVLGIEDRVCHPEEQAWHLGVMDEHFLSGVYNALDVLLNPSMSEGFGIPIIEAQACGVPVIVSNHSSMPELVGAGWLVEGDNWWDGVQESWAILPYIASIEDALEKSYAARGELKDEAVEFAQTYDADRVTDLYWKPAIEALDKPRQNGKETRQVRRARERKAAKV